MSWEAWLTLAVVVLAIGVMIRDLLPPAAAVLGGTVVLLLAGVIDSQQAFSGFSNPATLTIAVLYVLARAVAKTGALEPLLAVTLRPADGDQRLLARMLPPIAGASSVLNNTPIVALLVPEVSAWATRHGRSPARFLMPISFAAILGGTLTLIGTSTNLVVSGLLEASGDEPLGFFEMTPLTLPAVVAGLVMVIWLAPKVLRQRRDTRSELTEEAREFVIDMVVRPDGPLDGKTVEDGGLRHLAGVFLAQIDRGDEIIAPVGPHVRLAAGDRLRFVGKADNVVDLQSIPGLQSGERAQFDGFDLARSNFFEAVVGASSGLVGRTLKEARFRGQYQAVVVAIHRAGHRIDAKLGEVPLRVGDTLVLLSDAGFRDRWRDRRDFLLVSPLRAQPKIDDRRRWLVTAVLAGVVIAAATGAVDILHAALAGALAILGLRILTPGEARNAVDLDVVLLIAGGIGLASAMSSSGLAQSAADWIVSGFEPLGSLGVLIGIVVVAVLLTEAVSNVAAATIVFPIAVAAAQAIGADPRGYAIAVAFAASASFLTPIGYQTNTMVYGPGGYGYGDYARLGAPLTLLIVVAIVIGVPILWGV